jgi:hypothetical protein
MAHVVAGVVTRPATVSVTWPASWGWGLAELPGGHYAASLDGFDATVETEVDYLHRRLAVG